MRCAECGADLPGDETCQDRFHALLLAEQHSREAAEMHGLTVLMVSHDLSMVNQVAQHVLCLTDGRIECEGPPEAILRGEHLARTFGEKAGLFTHRHG